MHLYSCSGGVLAMENTSYRNYKKNDDDDDDDGVCCFLMNVFSALSQGG